MAPSTRRAVLLVLVIVFASFAHADVMYTFQQLLPTNSGIGTINPYSWSFVVPDLLTGPYSTTEFTGTNLTGFSVDHPACTISRVVVDPGISYPNGAFGANSYFANYSDCGASGIGYGFNSGPVDDFGVYEQSIAWVLLVTPYQPDVPEPSALLLVGSGLMAAAGFLRRKLRP